MAAWQMRSPTRPVRLVAKTGAFILISLLRSLFPAWAGITPALLYVRQTREVVASRPAQTTGTMATWQMWLRAPAHKVADGQISPLNNLAFC